MTPNGDVWDKQKKKVGEKNRFAVMAETAAKGFNGKVAFLDHWKVSEILDERWRIVGRKNNSG